jgi:hypothetical protein
MSLEVSSMLFSAVLSEVQQTARVLERRIADVSSMSSDNS